MPAPLGPTTATGAARRAGRGRRRRAPGLGPAGSGPAGPGAASAWRAVGHRRGPRRLERPAAGASMTAKTRAAGRRTRCSAWVGDGRPATSSKAASGIRAITASRTPLSRPAWTAGRPRPAPPTSPGRPAASSGRARCRPCARRGGRRRVSSASAAAIWASWASDRAVGDELGAPSVEVDDRRRQLAADRGRRGLAAPGEVAGQPAARAVAASSEATRRMSPAAGSIHQTSADGAAADRDGDHERRDAPAA